MSGYIVFLCLCTLCLHTSGYSLDKLPPKPDNYFKDVDVEGFLVQFGYLGNIPAGITGDELRDVFDRDLQVQDAIKDFQYFYGIPQSGQLDTETVSMMTKPRCGVPDIEHDYGTRKKRSYAQRFTHLGSKWKTNSLTWKLKTPTRKLRHHDQKRTIRSAFKIWEDETPLTIRETRGEPDIEILFARGEHNDGRGNAFDGKSRVLAHAFGPGEQKISGDAHFDDDEDWTLDPNDGSDLLVVAAHEFGHSLGLGHSRDKGALMYPAYISQDQLKLGYDDIRAVQTLYGSRINRPATRRPSVRRHTTPRPRVTPRPRYTPRPRHTPRPRPTVPAILTTPSPPRECTVDFDAVLEGPERYYYAIRQGSVFKFRESGMEAGYPRKTGDVFPGAPDEVDMAFSIGRASKIYLLKDNQVWRYTDLSLDEGYPLKFNREHFPETPRFVISLIDDRGVSRVIMFGETKWWFYNFDSMQDSIPMPYPISSNWRGVPRDVQYSVRWQDDVYYLVTPNGHVKFNHNRRVASAEGEVTGVPSWMTKTCSDVMDAIPNSSNRNQLNPMTVFLMMAVGVVAMVTKS